MRTTASMEFAPEPRASATWRYGNSSSDPGLSPQSIKIRVSGVESKKLALPTSWQHPKVVNLTHLSEDFFGRWMPWPTRGSFTLPACPRLGKRAGGSGGRTGKGGRRMV